MVNLDDEFARFEAEIQSLEQQTPNETTSIEDANDLPAKKIKLGLTAPSKEVVVKPKVYMAPPRPAPFKKTETSVDDSIEHIDGRSGLLNTLEDVAAHRGALSGFPAGTSGEHAAIASTNLMSGSYNSMQPRVDMETGCLLSIEEQHMMNRQQSVYAYDPKRTAASLAANSNGNRSNGGRGKHQKRHLRLAGGQIWEDPTLEEWPENDFRLFCGDLGNEVSDELLAHSFSKYPSFQRARVVRDKLTHKSRGYGFVSFTDPFDCAKALREMNGKYIGNRPVKLSKSKWQDRNIDVAKKKIRKRKRDKHHLFN
ncbi:protein tag-262 [Plasmopara halstedii]|uniref:Protein tag-262 n=1 Tax=Plasmopara halstedii TaxID=4781 RepID=A0A0P1B745_PLAHL|nr:protein tag-262 [Plasmopara halstedii]CEG49663.1 protein tag-262 [Plasmopara halstedii]|eukprot:XP_024586032.1 protein tag-262 [Plasmopara halstedii]